ncbi:CoA transferase [Acidiferrimicrobium sp. IK]|uniref:CaiB/BaiF CoA transferase family protein n=1 Tax=Acidiferrimicrobium sp. IK TaxID=2871700 RepID=UPI0021CAF2F9|nr:CoA transferase [Acidiferrimicrobium sp. IK]MCU4185250.1 CoA transferase [Acidiferrimicrobium sp. IK]
MTSGPLQGVRVADFGQFIAGPAVGQILADMGAVVVKVEPVGGEAARDAGALGDAMVATNNRDKLGLAVDLRQPAGLEVGRRLVAASDVVIQNMRPGAMDRLGLGPAQSLELNPRVVYLSITAFGAGADPRRAGLDIAAQAESGMMSVTGDADREPQRVGFAVVDQATAYAGAMAVLAALYRRDKHGEGGRGTVIDTSLLEVALHMQGSAWVQMFATGSEPVRKGNGYPSAAPAAEVITLTGGQIVVSAYTPAHWARLCEALERPEMVADPRFATNDARIANREAMRCFIAEALNPRGPAEAVEFLSGQGIVAGAIRSYREVVDGPDAARLGSFPSTTTESSGGYRYPAPPYHFGGYARPESRPAPGVGEHTRSVLADLGYPPDDIGRLLEQGAVSAWSTPDTPSM